MICYVVSAYPERRERIESQIREQQKVSNWAYAASPLGAAVAQSDTDLQPDPLWRDPLEKRLLTWGELACIAGHRSAWKRILSSGEKGGIVLEDDAELVGSLPNLEEIDSRFGEKVDLVLLGWKELQPGVVDANDTPDWGSHPTRRAGYCYWTVGYYATRGGAGRLLEAVEQHAERCIPLDELFSHLWAANPHTRDRPGAGALRALRLQEPLVRPSREWPSGTSTRDWAFQLDTVIPATNPQRAQSYVRQLESLGHKVWLLGEGAPNWDTTREGGRCKLEWLLQWLEDPQVREARQKRIVLVSDGYDVTAADGATPEEILARYGEMGAPLVVSGEIQCWPRRAGYTQDLEALGPYEGEDVALYPYPCSGLWMGPWDAMERSVRGMLDRQTEKDDQALLHGRVLARPKQWRIDREAYIFQSLGGTTGEYDLATGFNSQTRTRPLFLHRNGPPDHQPPSSPTESPPVPVLLENSPITPLADGIFAQRICSVDEAAAWASFLDARAGWGPLPRDEVPGDELRLRAISEETHRAWADLLERAWRAWIDCHWHPARSTPTRDLFAIRYRWDGQPSIGLHNDISRFSGSLVLTQCAKGGELHWPRQGADDRHLDPGVMAVWPSAITHPHAVRPVRCRETQRVSLVWWTEL